MGPSAWLHGPLPASGTIVRYALRMLGLGDQCALSVGFNGYSMNPSGPGSTLSTRARHLPVEAHRRAERPARHLEAADQRGEHRPRPHALEAAPAVVHRLAEAHGHRPVRHAHTLDVDRLADVRVVEELARDPPHRRRRHVADARRPFRRVRSHVRDELRERRLAGQAAVRQHVVVGPDLDRVDFVPAFERLGDAGRVVRDGVAARGIPHQRLPRRAVAQVIAVGADEIWRRRVLASGTARRAARADARAASRGRARTGTRHRSSA